MSDTNWPPAPWFTSRIGNDICVIDDTTGGVAVVDVMDNGEQEVATAHLIAAAPDMFAALEKMVEWHCVRGNTDEDPILDYERQPHEVRQAMDALSKARGES